MPPKKTPPFEKALQQLEAIVEQLEAPDIELDKAIKAFQEGQLLVDSCQKQLHEAQKVLKTLEE